MSTSRARLLVSLFYEMSRLPERSAYSVLLLNYPLGRYTNYLLTSWPGFLQCFDAVVWHQKASGLQKPAPVIARWHGPRTNRLNFVGDLDHGLVAGRILLFIGSDSGGIGVGSLFSAENLQYL